VGYAGVVRQHLIAHRRVANSLASVLERVWNRYGQTEISALRLNQFGGDRVLRLMTGANRWSMHAWGIAYDFDPQRNQLRWNHTQAKLARPEYREWWEIWETEGWYSLGRKQNFDWMHVQAAIRTY